ncbi:hypothetical protein RHSIM_Rhsim02G0246000 [Rhododendron simsii]|uniref:Transcriptional coactivator p15 (PC4) C-terminal domain-containing protein n=1 Tax=Rhododendron simsii TaxID=118357 RepID=A0A834LV35_RHOSS|nr:hypothetical protein RHSIM_Rhsim02G0246000 [Rhododendron simsii]
MLILLYVKLLLKLEYRGCEACGREKLEGRCNGEGRIQGRIATVPGFGWWPIKAYRPCPGFVASGGRYGRRGQSMDEVVSGSEGKGVSMATSDKPKSRIPIQNRRNSATDPQIFQHGRDHRVQDPPSRLRAARPRPLPAGPEAVCQDRINDAVEEEEEREGDDDGEGQGKKKRGGGAKEYDDYGDLIICKLSWRRRVTIQDFRGKTLVSIREFYSKDGKDLPSSKETVIFVTVTIDKEKRDNDEQGTTTSLVKRICLTTEQWSSFKMIAAAIEKAIRKMESRLN